MTRIFFAALLLGFSLVQALKIRAQRQGPYCWIRHPIYSDWLVMLVGHVLFVPHPAVEVAALLTAAGVVVEALRDDRHLHRTFGEHWAHYARATGRLTPRLWGARR